MMTRAGGRARAGFRWPPGRPFPACGCPSARVGLAFGNGGPRLAAVSGLADDLDVAGAREEHGEPARTSASSSTISTRICALTAATAARVQPDWPCSSNPCSRRPPDSVARSARPSRPAPVPGIFGSAVASAGVGLRTSMVRPCPGAPSETQLDRGRGRGLRGVVSASWTIRSAAADRVRDGGQSGRLTSARMPCPRA